MLGPLCFIAACWCALACGAFADVEIRIKLQHNLGNGFVDSGLITGSVAHEVNVVLRVAELLLAMDPHAVHAAVSFVEHLQIQPKSKLRLDWSIPETTVAQLNELAAADRSAAITQYDVLIN